MRLTCPNCDAQYEVDAAVIPAEGRDVQCSSCGHTWFQLPEGAEPFAPEAAGLGRNFDDDLLAEREAEAAPAATQAAAPPAGRRPLDEAVASVLREEAARERSVRQAEAARIEAQDDLGLPPAAPAPVAPPPAAEKSAAAPPPIPPGLPVKVETVARRGRLPDIEEINSTLRPDGEDSADGALRAADRSGRDGFRRGFLAALTVVVLALLPYIFATPLATRVPALAPALEAYSSGIDGLRAWLDGMMRSTTESLRASSSTAP